MNFLAWLAVSSASRHANEENLKIIVPPRGVILVANFEAAIVSDIFLCGGGIAKLRCCLYADVTDTRVSEPDATKKIILKLLFQTKMCNENAIETFYLILRH